MNSDEGAQWGIFIYFPSNAIETALSTRTPIEFGGKLKKIPLWGVGERELGFHLLSGWLVVASVGGKEE